MISPDQLEILAKRRDRAIASILGFKEAECDRYLPQEVALRLRKIILDQINDVYSAACSTVKDVDGEPSVVFNELYLQKLDEIYARLVLDA